MFALTLLACVASLTALAGTPAIRYTSEAPFADRKPVEKVWAKADGVFGFVSCVSLDTPTWDTTARLLFDDKNLYVTCRCPFSPKYVQKNKSVGRGNNIEFFIQGPAKDFVHVIVDSDGHVYTDRSLAEMRLNVDAWVENGPDYWLCNLTLPFKTLGYAAPKEDLPVRVLIARHNNNVPRDYKLFGDPFVEVSANVPLLRYAFGQPDLWEEMTMTRESAPVAYHLAPARGFRINLFSNSEFNAGFLGWAPRSCAVCQETQPMSGQWVAHVSGPGRVVMTGAPIAWKDDEEYTLCLRARSFGAGCSLLILEQCRNPNGGSGPCEGTYVTGNLNVGPDFHTYYLPFRTKKGLKPWYLAFLKTDSGVENSGVDIDFVKLYRGKIAPFEIRKMSFSGRGAITPGTGVAPEPIPYGVAARPLKVLAIVRCESNQREAMCLFAGTGARVDIVQASGSNEDVYGTLGDPKVITERLEKGDYDLYLIGRGREKAMGPKLRELIAQNLKKGAKRYDPPKERMNGSTSLLPIPDDEDLGIDDFPFDGLCYSELCDRLWTLALGAPTIPADARTKRTEILRNGKRHVVTKVKDAAGKTLSWKREVLPIAGAKLGAFTDDDEVSTVAVSNVEAGVRLAWEFRDFSDRVLAKGETSAASTVRFTVPRQKLYTNQGLIRLRLLKDGKLLDERTEDIYVRENDIRRLWDDYVVCMWPPMDGVPGEAQLRLRRLEDIGFNSSIFPDYPWGSPRSLKSGMGMGFEYAGGGGAFQHRHGTAKDNVRPRQYNTAESRSRISQKAKKTGRDGAKFGPIFTAVCDEPGMESNLASSSDELDAHPENLAEYRRRMERKYGTIAEYNRRHETTHTSFADVGQGLLADARRRKSAAEFIEWRNYNVDRWCEAIKLVCDGAATSCPGLRTSLYESSGFGLFSGNDYWKLLTKAGIGVSHDYTTMVYFNSDPSLNVDAFYHSFVPEMRVWGFTGYFFNRNRAFFMPWWFACHRYGGFSWFAAMCEGYNAMSNPGYELTLDGKELKESLEKSRLLDGLGKVLTVWKWAPRDIAIYYSYDSYLLSGVLGKEVRSRQICEEGPLHDLLYSRQGAQYAVEELLYQHDFIAPEQVVCSNRLASVKALLMPRVLAMSDAEVSAVKKYLMRGGKMQCDVLPGDYDELGVKRASNPFVGLEGIDVLGANFSHSDPALREKTARFLVSAQATRALGSPTILGHFGREAMHYVSGGADVYAVIRMLGRSSDDEADKLVFAKKGHVYDVRSWKYLGETDRVTVKVPKAEAAVFAVLPAKIEAIAVTGLPKTVSRGTDLSLDFSIKAPASQLSTLNFPSYVLHVEVIPPSGKPRFHFKRNLMTRDGKAHLDFATAFNDEPGTWKIHVREPLTGVSEECSFDLR